MVLKKQLGVMALMIAVAPAWGEPKRAANSVDRSSPESVFAAYKKAVNGRNWKSLFSLKTAEAQNEEIQRIAFFAALEEADPENPEEIRAYRAILSKHGIDLREVKKLVSEAEASGDKHAYNKDDFLVPMRRIVHRVADKPALFSEANDFCVKIGQPLSVKVRGLENLVVDGSTATGKSIETRCTIATVRDAFETRRVPQDFEGSSSIRFRNIDGEWFLD